ncbi:MepB family protein [Leeuwenhoekiella polynyae]|uniref:MepB protein n=1 Tax=Leeuwenhoekiella polynyae TaxID=1550906 RepID=A0A4Q0P2W0_9FLAO|nr:MepB family protein [Leeuwenhoekiella polynyae]RXG20890.1 hypothetical protein DSM02_2261 [Leeuwenhoekiella polynyae]
MEALLKNTNCMDKNLNTLKTEVYDKCSLEISEFFMEPESKEYDACRFKLNGTRIVSRSSKITPKKVGQFVTFWKRTGNGPIEPFDAQDPGDLYVVNVRSAEAFGQFVFPKEVLLEKGIISSATQAGKRACRVYPSWDIAQSKQAVRTQKWQLKYFYELNTSIDFKKVVALYNGGPLS